MTRIRFALAALFILGLAGCKTAELAGIGTDIAADAGIIDEGQKQSIDRANQALRQSFEDLSEEEEFIIGRAVAATILARYPLLENPALNTYVNLVGNAVAAGSTRPEIWNGYHFAVLDTDAVNAFAAPGGYVFITHGLLERIPDEDILATVLGHEIGHVAQRHGLAAIKKNRLLEAFAILGREAGTQLDQEALLELTELYEGAVGDVVRTVVESGYSRAQEEEADRLGVAFAATIGYATAAMPAFLASMQESGAKTGGLAVFETHPPTDQRIAVVREAVAAVSPGNEPALRLERFRSHTGAR